MDPIRCTSHYFPPFPQEFLTREGGDGLVDSVDSLSHSVCNGEKEKEILFIHDNGEQTIREITDLFQSHHVETVSFLSIADANIQEDIVILHPETEKEYAFFIENPDAYAFILQLAGGEQRYVTTSPSQATTVAEILEKGQREKHYRVGQQGQIFEGEKQMTPLSSRKIFVLSSDQYKKLTEAVLRFLLESALLFQKQKLIYAEIDKNTYASPLKERKCSLLIDMEWQGVAKPSAAVRKSSLCYAKRGNSSFRQKQARTEKEHQQERTRRKRNEQKQEKADERQRLTWKEAAKKFWDLLAFRSFEIVTVIHEQKRAV